MSRCGLAFPLQKCKLGKIILKVPKNRSSMDRGRVFMACALVESDGYHKMLTAITLYSAHDLGTCWTGNTLTITVVLFQWQPICMHAYIPIYVVEIYTLQPRMILSDPPELIRRSLDPWLRIHSLFGNLYPREKTGLISDSGNRNDSEKNVTVQCHWQA